MHNANVYTDPRLNKMLTPEQYVKVITEMKETVTSILVEWEQIFLFLNKNSKTYLRDIEQLKSWGFVMHDTKNYCYKTISC